MVEDEKKGSGESLTADELLASAKALKQRIENSGVKSAMASPKAVSSAKDGDPSSSSYEGHRGSAQEFLTNVQSMADNLSYFRRFLRDTKEIFCGLRDQYFAPVSKFVSPPLSWLVGRYKRIWQRYAFVVDPQSGERVLSRKRSSLLIGATVLVFSVLTPTRLGDAVRFVTTEPVGDAFLMLVSKKNELFFLNNSEEIDPEANTHAVRGCRRGGQCTEKDAVYFRVLPRLSHDLWKLITYGNPIYVPDHVVAPISPGVNRCEVTYYGYRMTSSWISRLLRSLEIYPVMLEANCTAVTSDIAEKQRLGGGVFYEGK